MIATKKHTILIVDDLSQNLMVLKRILEREDREIITCLSGNEALQVLLKEKVSLILVDVQMPEMDGYEFVQIVKNHPDMASIPTVFVTAISNDPEFLNRAYELGALDFLFKPLSVEMTRKKVDSFLKIWDNEQELKSLNEKLQEKNAELEQFANVIAHDLKSPLCNIKSLIEFIEAEHPAVVNSGTPNLFEMVKISATSMAKLIDDLLYYSKNVGNSEDKKNIHILTEIEETIKLINPGTDVKINKENLDYSVVFQPVAFKQIIQNLLSNAIKYNDKNITEIDIAYSEDKKALFIKDNGPGIPENQQERVFDMFYTLGKTSKCESSSGIGLNLVKKLAERNSVEVQFNNAVFEGTEVIISNLTSS